VRRLAAVILGDDDELLAVDAARRVDFLDRKLPALAIGFGEGGQQRIAVDLADLDLTLRHRAAGHARHHDRQTCSQYVSTSHPYLQYPCEIIANHLRLSLPKPSIRRRAATTCRCR